MINEFLAPKPPPNHNVWFQQDGATVHTAVISMAALRLLFSQRVISRFGDMPPRSPDLTALDVFSVGLFENKACSRCPVGLNALKQAIRDEIINISEETLREGMRIFLTRVHLCIHEGGGHLIEIVHKK